MRLSRGADRVTHPREDATDAAIAKAALMDKDRIAWKAVKEQLDPPSSKSLWPRHPVDEATAAFYHGVLAGLALLGLWFHVISALRHWRDRA